MSELSKLSDVPYTTISELKHSKIDINRCAAATVFKLAATLGVSEKEILNPIKYVIGASGEYKGMPYLWKVSPTQGVVLEVQREEERITIPTGKNYCIPRWSEFADVIAGFIIEDYFQNEASDSQDLQLLEQWEKLRDGEVYSAT